LCFAAVPAVAQHSYLDDANPAKRIPANPLPSFQHHSFPRTLVHELQGPATNAAYGKYDFIDAHGSSFDRVANIQGAYSQNTMLLRHISARAYQNFNANYCRISSGIAFESSGRTTQGGPEETSGCSVYAGHWLYRAGTRTTQQITAQATTVQVQDASRVQAGQYVVIYDGPPGSFNNAEHARVSSVNENTNTITFNKRGFKSVARSRASGAIVAQHVLGQGPEEELWAFNTSTECPRDANGETWNSFYAKWLARNYDRYNDGQRTNAKVAGILFDADMYFELPNEKADYNNDLVVDNGISPSGVNWQGDGLDQFYADTRRRLPDIHIMAGLHDARGYAANNGIQMENWLDFGNGDFKPNPQYEQINSMFATYLFNMRERDIQPPIAHNLTKTPTRMYKDGTQAASNAPFRLGLAMTLMDDGYFGTHAGVTADAWWDEYAVDVNPNSPNFGRAADKNNLTQVNSHKGWLGDPLGKFTRVYDSTKFARSKNMLANGSLESGVNSWSGSNVSVSASNNAHEGSGAMHVSKMRSYNKNVYGATVRSEALRLTAGVEYTVSFMARAAEPREMRVSLGSLNEKIPVGKNWRRYVLSFRQVGNQNTALNLQVGREDTTVWFDSLYVFTGSANVFRRDFENGIVLANASPLPKTIELGGTFRKIRGSQDTNINDGTNVTKVTLNGYDGVLLIRLGGSTPAPTTPPPADDETPTDEGQLGDLVWQDDNSNGLQDNGEEGLPGVKVNLYDCSNRLITSTSTNASGRYSFRQLASGNYAVGFELQDGMTFSPKQRGNDNSADSDADPATGRTACTSLGSNQTRNGLDAGMVVEMTETPQPDKDAAFGDFVWVDSNRNGLQDPGEAGLPGAQVKLMTCSNEVLKTTTTDANGRYRFGGLSAGQYRLEFPTPTGMQRTLSKQGDDASKDSNPDQNSGRTQCLSVTGTQFRGGIDVGLIANQPNNPSPPSNNAPNAFDTPADEQKNFGEGGGGTGVLLVGLLGLLAWRRRV
jgi:5-hydroxyisourate hydrolase-like protein (transthyretin family)